MPKSKHHKEQPISGLRVEVRNNDINKALRKFKKKVQNSGLMDDIRKNEFFEKPTNKRKIKKAMAVKREKKRQSLELRPSRRPSNRY